MSKQTILMVVIYIVFCYVLYKYYKEYSEKSQSAHQKRMDEEHEKCMKILSDIESGKIKVYSEQKVKTITKNKKK